MPAALPPTYLFAPPPTSPPHPRGNRSTPSPRPPRAALPTATSTLPCCTTPPPCMTTWPGPWAGCTRQPSRRVRGAWGGLRGRGAGLGRERGGAERGGARAGMPPQLPLAQLTLLFLLPPPTRYLAPQDAYLADVYEFYVKHLEDEGPIAGFKCAAALCPPLVVRNPAVPSHLPAPPLCPPAHPPLPAQTSGTHMIGTMCSIRSTCCWPRRQTRPRSGSTAASSCATGSALATPPTTRSAAAPTTP